MNKSGLHPVGFCLLIAPEEIETKTEAGIILHTETQKDKEQMGQIYGRVVEVGPMAFCDESVPRCKVGDLVVYRRYAGENFRGIDGVIYRVITDKDVWATKEP